MHYAAVALAFVVTLIMVWLLARTRIALDKPNERSMHQTPVPRTGGLGLMAGVLAAWFLIAGAVPWVIVGGAMALIVVSAIDDLRSLPVLVRLGAHLIAAVVVCVSLAGDTAGWFMAGVLTLATAWMANAYNFMDGSDGLAGGMAACGFFCYGLAAHDMAFAIANFCIAASAGAFLVFNFPPAKIFLGDAGSIPLGFLAASLGIAGWVHGDWAWWFPLVVFAPFVADATVTLLKRAVSGEPVWKAHREHTYQRLIRMGWSHRRLALSAYLLMAACGIAALVALNAPMVVQWALLAVVAAGHLALIGRVGSTWRATQAQGPGV